MSRKYKFWDSNRMYFISFATVHCFREQQHNQPLEITCDKMYAETVWYIHQNPVVAGFVYESEQWIYSSAKGYANNDGIIKLAEC